MFLAVPDLRFTPEPAAVYVAVLYGMASMFWHVQRSIPLYRYFYSAATS
jgi:hypothetical protein